MQYKNASCGTIPTKAQLIKSAEEWVRYANITKNYNIKYWMIGNESYMSCNYNGCATATQYRNDLIDFSIAMKAIDPTIKIIANGESSIWWQTVLPTAAQHIDYLGLSNYPVWQYTGGYGYYRTRTPDLIPVVNRAANAISQYAPSSERNRLKIIVSEFGSMDWSGVWPDLNDLGHALVSFEIMGDQLKHPKVVGSYFWNTRWIDNATKNNDIYDALSKNGSFNANGISHSIWGKFLTGGNMVQASGNTQIRTFANHNPITNKLNLFIINKETSTQSVNLSINGFASNATGAKWEFKGSGISSVSPTFQQNGTVTANANTISLSLPATSITVLELSDPGSATLAPPTASDQSRCGSGTLTLTASNGTNYRWYKNASGGSILNTGSSFTTPNLTQTDSFYVSNFNSTTESSRIKVRAIIHPIPSSPVVSDISRCGIGNLTLTASGGTNYKWYDVFSGTSSIHTGITYTTPSLNSTTTYYVGSWNGNCRSSKVPIQAIIEPIPVVPIVSGAEKCGPGTLQLTASGGNIYNWFSQQSGGNTLYTGQFYSTPQLNSTTTYYVSNSAGNCTSSRVAVQAVIKDIPEKPEITQINPDKLYCSEIGGNYEWKLNNVLLNENTREIDIYASGDYTVRVEDISGCFSLFSDQYNVTLTSIANFEKPKLFKVYPNPGYGKLTIEIPQPEINSKIKVIDLTGKIIYSEKISGSSLKKKIILELYTSGVYFLTLIQQEHNYKERLIIK